MNEWFATPQRVRVEHVLHEGKGVYAELVAESDVPACASLIGREILWPLKCPWREGRQQNGQPLMIHQEIEDGLWDRSVLQTCGTYIKCFGRWHPLPSYHVPQYAPRVGFRGGGGGGGGLRGLKPPPPLHA